MNTPPRELSAGEGNKRSDGAWKMTTGGMTNRQVGDVAIQLVLDRGKVAGRLAVDTRNRTRWRTSRVTSLSKLRPLGEPLEVQTCGWRGSRCWQHWPTPSGFFLSS